MQQQQQSPPGFPYPAYDPTSPALSLSSSQLSYALPSHQASAAHVLSNLSGLPRLEPPEPDEEAEEPEEEEEEDEDEDGDEYKDDEWEAEGKKEVVVEMGERGEDEPLYVNAKQYHRILKRRVARARLEEMGRLSRQRKVRSFSFWMSWSQELMLSLRDLLVRPSHPSAYPLPSRHSTSTPVSASRFPPPSHSAHALASLRSSSATPPPSLPPLPLLPHSPTSTNPATSTPCGVPAVQADGSSRWKNEPSSRAAGRWSGSKGGQMQRGRRQR